MSCARKKLRISVQKKTRRIFPSKHVHVFTKVVRVWMKLVRVFPNLSAENKSAYEIDKKPSSLVYPLFFT